MSYIPVRTSIVQSNVILVHGVADAAVGVIRYVKIMRPGITQIGLHSVFLALAKDRGKPVVMGILVILNPAYSSE